MTVTCAAFMVQPGACAEAPGPAAPQLRLIGTIKTPGGGMAIFLDARSGQSFSLKVGDNFERWTLRSVQDRRVTFKNASDRTSLELLEPANGIVFQPSRATDPGPQAATPPPRSTAAAPAGGSWMDGDGNMIAPPVQRKRP
jgi:hypothetical protein